MSDPFFEKAKEILSKNIYMCLATVDGKQPWVTPLYFSSDDKFTFYFVSDKDSDHVRFLISNPEVAIAIYDSTQPPGTGEGVWATGLAGSVEVEELTKVLDNYYQKRFPDENERKQHDLSPARFLEKSSFRFYKVVPQHVYVHDTSVSGVDQRIEVQLP
jgi:nitroimidazol reductase NimA-like FMN-containing flavoprotein (pyridoxamine 5'-phosphate oxidase superfamily)